MRVGILAAWVVFTLPTMLLAGDCELVAPTRLRCEYLVDPDGIDVARPRLSWEIAARQDIRGASQSAYQVRVASSLAGLADGQWDRWDSGKVASQQSIHVEYAGTALAAGGECYWKVRVWDRAGRSSEWSEPARWSMGLLKPSDWTARWITGPSATEGETTTLPLLRRQFRIDKPVRRAMLYVSSLGYHRADLNGRKVGDHEWDPVQSDYSRRVYYVTHNVTGQVEVGENALAVGLGKGWYWKGIRGVIQARPALLAELIVEHRDGSSVRVASDGTWKAATSPVRVIGGRRNAGGDFGVEVYDARQEQAGWQRASFDDCGWAAAEVVPSPAVILSAQMIAPNRVVERLPTATVRELEPGQYLLDFGKNLTGRLRMKVAGRRGAEIRLAYFASHTGDWQRLTENFHQADRYICRGGGGEEFASQFNWRAFRFVRVSGLAARPQLTDAVAELISTDLAQTGSFECSDPAINRLQELVVHTHRCLTLGGIQVDCPHRERLGYGAEGQGSLMQALYNFDAGAFYAKWARDFQDGQDPKTGMVYYTAPFRIDSGGGPAWSGACIVFPWHVYLFHGDRRVLAEAYPTIQRWLECLESHRKDGLLEPYGLPKMGIWQYLGDWASPRRPHDTLPCNGHWTSEEENRVFNDLHHYLQVSLAARIATVLGKSDDAARYRQRAERIARAINGRYFDPRTARYTRGEQQQTYLGFPLWLGIVPEEHRERVMENLVNDVTKKRGGHLDFGVLGGVYTLAALANRADIVHRIATVPSWPGWGYLVDRGARTLWEHWLPGDSSIHNSFLSIGGWLYEGLAGIRPDPEAPGFRRVILRPQLAPQLTWVKASYRGMYGVVESRESWDGRQFTWEIAIPAGSTGKIYCPAASLDLVRERGTPAARAEGVRAVGVEEGNAVFELQSGRYRLEGSAGTYGSYGTYGTMSGCPGVP